MYQEPWNNYFFAAKPVILEDRWGRLRKTGRDILSPQAQLKLEWIIFYHTIGEEDATKTALYFGISRKTLHKSPSRFTERFNWTIRDEWLSEYNTHRPHEARAYETPSKQPLDNSFTL